LINKKNRIEGEGFGWLKEKEDRQRMLDERRVRTEMGG
jgi:hypothetical protein